MSYVVTKYQEAYHEQAPKQYQCLKGSSIVEATINISAWNPEGTKIGDVLIKPGILFSYGLLRKILFSKGEQVNKVFLSEKTNNLIQDIFARGLVYKGYDCLEINAQPRDFTS